MPFYEYQCSACGAQTEVLQKITDAPLKKCPDCGKNKLVKLVSAPVFRLKGGGWYETDFKSDNDRKRNLDDSGKEPPAEKADKPAEKETSSDSKPAAKPAPVSTGAARKPAAKAAAKKPAARAARKPAAKPARSRAER
jgi:putative FmdB family regulatory protein